jgi:hypothetical protein
VLGVYCNYLITNDSTSITKFAEWTGKAGETTIALLESSSDQMGVLSRKGASVIGLSMGLSVGALAGVCSGGSRAPSGELET